MKIVEEELDESIYWMELLIRVHKIKDPFVCPLMNEAKELLAMTIASIKTAKRTVTNSRS